MTCVINASPTNGIQMTSDGSGIVKLQSNSVTTNALAWVNFVGSTAAIRASYNVSSITRSAAGKYTLNFTNSSTDANYSPVITASPDGSTPTFTGSAQLFSTGGYTATAPTTSGFVFAIPNNGFGAFVDPSYCSVIVFGN